MLVTVERYRAITGDEDTPTVTASARLEDAADELAEVLDRPLEQAERTERLWPTRDGRLWPRATPIVTAAGYTIDGLALIGASAPFWPFYDDLTWLTGTPGVDVTYTGGWVERSANPDATNRLPACIERDIAWAAWTAGQPVNVESVGAPVGAKSVSVGDVSVTYGDDGAPGNSGSRASASWGRRTLSYRYRVERSN